MAFRYFPWLAVILSGVLGGVLGSLITGSRSAHVRTKASAEPAAASESGQPDILKRRVEALERAVSTLQREARAARMLSAYGSAAADDEGAADGGKTKTVDDPVFEVAVRDIIEQVNSERSSERRTARRQANAERWTQRLAEQVALSEPQKARVMEIVGSFFEKLGQLRESERERAEARPGAGQDPNGEIPRARR
jgi:hypothetical protein